MTNNITNMPLLEVDNHLHKDFIDTVESMKLALDQLCYKLIPEIESAHAHSKEKMNIQANFFASFYDKEAETNVEWALIILEQGVKNLWETLDNFEEIRQQLRALRNIRK